MPLTIFYYSGSRWHEVRTETCNPYPARILLYFIRSGTAIITGREPGKIYQVQENELPYPSLNEVNYIAFNELSIEYHNELYSYIEAEDLLSSYKNNKPSRAYIRILRNGQEKQESIVLTEYIRNQIHHPENDRNVRFTDEELKQSIEDMRNFIAGSRAASNS